MKFGGMLGVAADFVTTCLYVPMMAVCAFRLFGLLKLQSSLINRISASTFSVYLIHDFYLLRDQLWDGLVGVDRMYASPFFPALASITVLVVFIVCTIIDIVRETYLWERAVRIACRVWASVATVVFELEAATDDELLR